MIQSLHDSYLPSDRFLSLQVFHLFLEVDLKSYFAIISPISAQVNDSISSRSYLLTKDVVLHTVVLTIDYDLFFFLLSRFNFWLGRFTLNNNLCYFLNISLFCLCSCVLDQMLCGHLWISPIFRYIIRKSFDV